LGERGVERRVRGSLGNKREVISGFAFLFESPYHLLLFVTRGFSLPREENSYVKQLAGIPA
jgi:hypothetical protein